MNTEEKTILVTGGAGFIGTNFIRYALAKRPEWKVFNLDALTYAGNPMNFEDIRDEIEDRYTFVHGDIRNKGLLDKIFKENKFHGMGGVGSQWAVSGVD